MKSLAELLGDESTEKATDERLPQWNPSDIGYDTGNTGHVAALRLFPGARYLRPNRYRTPEGYLVDRHGSMQDLRECPECGSVPGVANFRYLVREPRTPGRLPWEATYRPCSRCVSSAELRENEVFMSGQPPARR